MTQTPHDRAELARRALPLWIIALAMGAILIALTISTLFGSSEIDRAREAAAVALPDPFAALSLEAKAGIVIDMSTGKVLYEKNADVQLPLASLTKVALALVVAEAVPLDSRITIPYYVGGSEGKEHLDKGEVWRVRDVIDFMLVASSNAGAGILADAANGVIHERFPDSPPDSATLWRMNDLAKNLKLSHTYFLNVSGLDLSETQSGAYGSARDMASLFAYAASANPSLFAGTAEGGILLTAPSGQTKAAAVNTNEAEGTIPGLIMGKTGLTDLAGGNLAIVFDVGLAHPVVAVVLGSSEKARFEDMQKLVAAARHELTREPR